MKVAIEGCCHGELDKIYSQISFLEKKNNYKVDLLLICGDFQAIRNHSDLQCMAVPQKYRQLGGFYRYYTGEKRAPVPTVIIGGNHEASNYFWELYHGGYIAPNIYYLGQSGCIRANGLRIAGSSGIFKDNHYNMGHPEHLPYTDGSMRSIYHTRSYQISKLMQLGMIPSSSSRAEGETIEPIDLFLSHDWPQSIAYHGDVDWLFRTKPFFKKDVETGQLGSPPLMQLLRTVKPKRWFSAHLHVRFEAKVDHTRLEDPAVVYKTKRAQKSQRREVALVQSQPITPPVTEANPDEIKIDDDDEVVETSAPAQPGADADATRIDSKPTVSGTQPTPDVPENPDEIKIDVEEEVPPDGPAEASLPEISVSTSVEAVSVPTSTLTPTSCSSSGIEFTHFLALDKCLPKRDFLEVIDVPLPEGSPSPSPPVFTFDPQWLAICRAFHPYFSLERTQRQLPSLEETRELVLQELKWVEENVGSNKQIDDVQKFAMTAPGPSGMKSPKGQGANRQPPAYLNAQTEALCNLLQIENKINPDGLRISAFPKDVEGSS